MLRRLHPEQPDSFAFTPANLAWAEAQVTKFPEGRQASAVIPLLWRAQEQEGWLTRPAIEAVADMLGMAYIRVLEVASFYFMFQLQPVGTVAHIQICGTTSCMICGAEDLIAVCKEKIADKPHTLSADGKFSWEEVECLGSCTNAPMAQIGKDYYEDLTAKRFGELLDELAAGKVPVPGPQNGRYASEPLKGLTSLTEYDSGKTRYNASVQLATDIGDTVKRIDGTEVPLLTPWIGKDGTVASRAGKVSPPPAPAAPKPAVKQTPKAEAKPAPKPEAEPVLKPSAALPGQEELAARKGSWRYEAPAAEVAQADATGDAGEEQPLTLSAAREGGADDLKLLKGVGPKLEGLLNELGFYHFDQVAAWTPAQVAWVDARLTFKGRIERDGWIEQARQLAAGEETEFAKRAKKDGIYDE
ncbi:NADH-quinone oxidoreductase subunit E [Ruegeria pomeroyi]|uniref:NADH:ubiquinone oxidoreductase 41 kD complex I subunit n=2 Tax=Ruegeria pomeroyi TaxID=89184 RepID=Q5LPR9_RUEPO|nr:NADH-quinone oxidoreductase subunit E [Ruegeria pomeroyi]AAV96021.1 NADH:ubiquinone oxidoreductase 41 kD complex I subunit [Ruegeria pomeroyi DSS-3]NVK97956.1 NADH-quinone oxidoreductase subunit E [Ruegeria pomeroyi]NVL04038.1 NADH-quinone oxidoreductase subunit E [Ruegeria pomeroyi]QWV09581.1 NADH-quinone oxidoreductase subunit E [Ruegeria pomeroyi]